MTIRAIVVDDEPLARSRLCRLLVAQGVTVIAEGENGQQAVDLVRQKIADILFIDINMPVKTGLQAVREIGQIIEEPPAIVFCTAYDEYAIQAFKTDATAYLLKPIQAEDVAAAMKKAAVLNRYQVNHLMEHQHGVKSLAVNYQGSIQNMPLNRFAYFRSIEKNVFAVLNDGSEILIDKTLKFLEVEYSDEFVRVHRSTLMNRHQALRLVRHDGGSAGVEIKLAGVELAVSRRHLSEVKKCFQ